MAVEQSAIKIKRLPTPYCLKFQIAQKKAVHSRSWGLDESLFSNAVTSNGEGLLLVFPWLGKPEYCPGSRGAGCLYYYEGVIPVEGREHRALASVCTMKVLFTSRDASLEPSLFALEASASPDAYGICALY